MGSGTHPWRTKDGLEVGAVNGFPVEGDDVADILNQVDVFFGPEVLADLHTIFVNSVRSIEIGLFGRDGNGCSIDQAHEHILYLESCMNSGIM